MSWEKGKLKDVVNIKKGDYITKKDANVGQYPVILGGQEPAYYIDKYNHIGKAIVVSRSGASAGFVSYWDEPIFVTDGFLIEPKSNANFKFVYYLMRSKQKMLHSLQRGAAIPHVTPKLLYDINISLPPIETQKKIANILSAYDDLIENNQKQIKLLEEAAQRLYKEWFVDLHFPGHESTPIIDGIPQGWKKEKIDDVYDIKYGKTLPTTKISGNGEYPVYGANGVIGYYNQCNYIDYVTLITSRGNGSGDVSRTHHKKAFITNNSFIVNPKESFQHCKLPFTYLLFLDLDFRAIRTGSAQPQLTNTSISTLNLLMPSKEIVLNFIEKTSAIFEKIEVLYQSISNAIEARDRLLPKLMNGEIEVAVNKQETVMVDKFENIRKHWQNVPYDEDLPLAARSTGDISEETLEKLKEIAEEE